VAASAIALFAITGAQRLGAPRGDLTSDVIDGVEVDYCVRNPNANTVTGVPGVNVDFEFGLKIGVRVLSCCAERGPSLVMSPGQSSRTHSTTARTVRT
jgi:hypothetical protein